MKKILSIAMSAVLAASMMAGTVKARQKLPQKLLIRVPARFTI